MTLASKIAIAAAVPLLLAGCGTTNRGLESVHQPVVDRTDIAFDVALGDRGLSAGEAQRLDGWLRTLHVGYGDRIAIDDATSDPGVRDAVAGVASRYGMLLAEDAPVTTGAIAPGTARIVVSRMRASVPGCPDWSRVGGIDYNANTTSNYGCSVNANLAAMVAQPEDLVRGMPGTGVVDPATTYKAIDSYRRAKPTGEGQLKSESTKGS